MTVDVEHVIRAPRTCPRCQESWSQVVEVVGLAGHRTRVCRRCTALRPLPPTPDLGVIAPQREWAHLGSCAQTDPDLFHPEDANLVKDALAVCDQCPVVVECLQWALGNDEKHGVWGGTTPTMRRRMLKARDASSAA